MGCTRNHLKIWGECAVLVVLIITAILPSNVWAAFASQFSLSAGEEYNDNIFFSNSSRVHDFITIFNPTFTFLYAPPGQVVPTLNINLSPSYQIYALHSDLNNWDNFNANAGYTYQYSPRLTFNFSDSLQHQGITRNVGLGTSGQFPTGPTSPPPVGGGPAPPQNLNDLISQGKTLSNYVTVHGSYLYRPDISLTADYTNSITSYTQAGGTDVYNTIGARGVYKWNEEHNLHAGYTISIYKSRNGGNDNGVVHNFDLGDDYFSNYNLQLTPTLSLAASTGLSLNTGSGQRFANNTSITITKLWETAQINGGLRKGLTPSYGVSGISDTTSLFTNFNWRLTERLSTYSNANFSFYDTKDVNFKTFQAGLGLQYAFTSYLSSNLGYNFNWIDSGSGASSTDLLQQGITKSNSVFLYLTMNFDLWPNTGLARSISSPTLTPILRTPFPIKAPEPVP